MVYTELAARVGLLTTDGCVELTARGQYIQVLTRPGLCANIRRPRHGATAHTLPLGNDAPLFILVSFSRRRQHV